jgi:hypothetical protein
MAYCTNSFLGFPEVPTVVRKAEDMVSFTVYLDYAGDDTWDIIELWHYDNAAPVIIREGGYQGWYTAEVAKRAIVAHHQKMGRKMAGEI